MNLARSFVALLLALSLAALAGPSAQAQTVHLHDPAGDGFKGQALDITSMVISNRPHHVSVTISFARLTSGDFAVSFKRPGDKTLFGGVASTHSRRHTKSKLFSVPTGVRPCQHLIVRWEPRPDEVRILIPSHCLDHGHFSDIKAQLITEVGSDADYFPNPKHGHFGWSRWVARG
jgi:hypothetical protein